MNTFFEKIKSAFKPDRLSRTAVGALVIAIVIVINAVVYALDAAYGLYLYTPDSLDLTLSEAPDAAFEKAVLPGDEVTVLFCMAEDDIASHSSGRYVYETAKQMAQRYDFLTLEFVNIVINPDRVEPYRTDKKGRTTPISASSVIFIHNENYRVLTDTTSGVGFVDFYTLDDSGSVVAYNGEEIMTSMILWVMKDTFKTAYFTVGHGEVATGTLTTLLACAGYYIDTIDLSQKGNEVPADAALLIVSNPTKDFERSAEGSSVRSEMDRLNAYMEKGGTVLALLDPYLKADLTVLKDFLATYGLSFATTEVDGTAVGQIVKDSENGISTDGFTLVCNFGNGDVSQAIRQTLSSGTGSGVVTSSAGVMTLDASLGAQALLVSSSSAVAQADGKTVDREGLYPVAAYAEKTAEGKTSRVVVVSSIYLMASDAMLANGYANRDFFYALIEKCDTDAAVMPYGCRAALVTSTTLENLTMGTARRLTALFLAIPALLAVIGTVVVVRRKNR